MLGRRPRGGAVRGVEGARGREGRFHKPLRRGGKKVEGILA